MDSSTISIEAGCVFLGNNTWEYRYGDNDGQHKIVFQSVIKPKIGDTLVDGVLIIRTEPKINEDYSKWLPPEQDVWPTNKMFD